MGVECIEEGTQGVCRKLIVSSHFEDEGSLKMVLQDGSVVDPSISGCGNLGEGL